MATGIALIVWIQAELKNVDTSVELLILERCLKFKEDPNVENSRIISELIQRYEKLKKSNGKQRFNIFSKSKDTSGDEVINIAKKALVVYERLKLPSKAEHPQLFKFLESIKKSSTPHQEEHKKSSQVSPKSTAIF